MDEFVAQCTAAILRLKFKAIGAGGALGRDLDGQRITAVAGDCITALAVVAHGEWITRSGITVRQERIEEHARDGIITFCVGILGFDA